MGFKIRIDFDFDFENGNWIWEWESVSCFGGVGWGVNILTGWGIIHYILFVMDDLIVITISFLRDNNPL